ncbi:glycosyltransferase family protein [Pedobacter insulae]|uniref:Membrane protein YfhO n=1 Tax=Pedobacter insulae TaxID=414048 RepID=A0A1I2TGC8_9SPHI|nr:hypothetical protein [Pedobacter insulae]SFG61586.1 hypothetical protein SAMN04489864_101269 [Pedobacter insulae]
MNNWFKQNGTHLAIIAFFVVICFAYFSPVLQGKRPAQSDVLQAKGMQKEIMEYKEKDGKAPLWTNQMFGGMPAYQIWVPYAYNAATYGIAVVTKTFPTPIGTVLLLLLGSYFLFIVLKINPWLAAAGAIAFSFTTYNFVLIATGHSNKALAIGFFAPIIAGILLTLRGKYWLGASLTALFLALEIRSNHIQMTYYLFLAILIFMGIELYQAYKNKTLPALGKAVGFLAIAVLLSVMVNASLLWTTSEYAKETNRGKSNLTNTAGQTESMSKEYAYAWSQGVGESFTFLISDLYGASHDRRLDEKSEVFKAVQSIGASPEQAIGFTKQMPIYWGEKSYTSGGYYFGAIVCFLFVFGLFIVRSPLKWWVLSVTVLFILLSFGKHFPLVSDLFFDYFPLYNKFRAVESILAVVGLMVPILAFLAMKEVQEGKHDEKVIVKKLMWSAAITGGFSLLVAILPTLFFSFKTSTHAEFVQQLGQSLQSNELGQRIANALVLDREAIARADAFRSFLFIAIAFGIVWAFITKKIKMEVAYGLLGLAILIDMWQVDKRYLNKDNFRTKAELTNNFTPRDVDNFILADKDPNFRVYDQSVSTFNDASTTAFHKTIGGYHAAKLKRYDELISKQLSTSVNQDVLDMLNAKYFITQDPQNGSYKMSRNATALGNAWLVKGVQFVKDSDEEMKAISSFDPKLEAIVDIQYKDLLDTTRLGADPSAFIKMESYHPDHLVYSYSAPRDVIAVFSEIYYDKGWNMYIDGEQKPYFRADYVLRAAQLTAGNHKLEFKFEPKSYYMGEKISLAGSVLLIAFLGLGFYTDRKRTS